MPLESSLNVSISRSLFINGAYASSIVSYSYLNERSSRNIYDANIALATKRTVTDSDQCLPSVLKELGVDKIYVLNLARRSDRKLRTAIEFAKYGIFPTYFSAVDANDVRVDGFYENHLRHVHVQSIYDEHLSNQHKTSLKYALTKGAVAYKLSQKAIFNDAHSNGFRRVAVFDDDVFFSNYTVSRINNFFKGLSTDWKIVALGASDYSLGKLLSDVDVISEMDSKGSYTPVPGKTCGSFAMLYDRSVYEELMQGCEYPSGTYDNTVLGAMYAKYPNQSFVLFPNVVTPCVDESDIRHSRNQLVQSQLMFWDLSNYKRWSANLDVFVVSDDSGRAESALAHLVDTHVLTIQFVSLDQANGQISKTDLSAQTTIGALQAPNKIYELIFAELAKVRSPIDVKRFFVFLIDGGVVL